MRSRDGVFSSKANFINEVREFFHYVGMDVVAS